MSSAEHLAKAAIVTGAARGIGASIAQRLARGGWTVIGADIDPAIASAMSAVGGLGVACDVAAEDGVDRLALAARQHGGRIDAVVCNAGINANGPLRDTSTAAWNRVLAVNLTSAFLLARTCEKDLRSSGGALVTIASTRAHMSEPDTLAYSASKGGLLALTHALALTLAPDVRVNCVSPGWIDTGKSAPPRPSDHAQHPAGRVGRPEDVAGAVAYLLSEDARFVTGAELIVDGGMTRKMIYEQ
jgi:NAD(P)-dependent dehydrogenase (short-subunit alcohol dehydrogenase family)